MAVPHETSGRILGVKKGAITVMTDHPGSMTGLSEAEATRRLKEEGPNELPTALRRGVVTVALEVAREPMFLLLIAAGAIYLALGDRGEALMLLGFVFVVMGITIVQARKTERALEALRDLSSPRVLVMRDGEHKRIAGREVVPGDMLVLVEGDRVPADAVLLTCQSLWVDESLLTGESAPVRKIAWDGVMEVARPGGDDLPFVYSGTLLVKGKGFARTLTTGSRTEIGKIGKALQAVEDEKTPLQQETGRLVRNLALIGLLLCVVVVMLYGVTRHEWFGGLLAGITLAMAVIPEEFPVVLTVFLALGAWRISQQRVLTRRIPVVETLGAATVLCVDKTGTLTLNRMTVAELFVDGEPYHLNHDGQTPLREKFHEIVEFSLLASDRDPFDPMEQAFKRLGERDLAQTEHLHHDWTLAHDYAVSPQLMARSRLWRSPDHDGYIVAAKGAPEAIADLCRYTAAQRQELSAWIGSMADEGLRVLGVARADFNGTPWPADQRGFDFQFLGLVGLADPVRPTVPAALAECAAAGIRVVMITGDYPGTARAVARQIGMAPGEEVMTGVELERLGDDDLRRRIHTINIFARVVPEQKLRLVNALKAAGAIVAMTGDGVNDAPALKSAHIGIAMGERGTDVAREASSLVLLDDDFASIVQAVHVGRRIFDNLQKAMAYTVAVHVPIVGMSLIPLLLHWPLMFSPIHIVFLQLIIDPACSIVFEAEPAEADVMRRPPRNSNEPLFGRRTLVFSVLQGMSVLVMVLAVFGITLSLGEGEREARALAFATLVMANLALIFTNRSWSRTILATLRTPNSALWWVLGGALLFLGLVLSVDLLRDLFRFAPLPLAHVAMALAAGVAGVLWFEAVKRSGLRMGRAAS